MSNAPPTRPAISASRDAKVECEREGKRRKEIKGRVKRKLIMQKVKKKRKLIIQKVKKKRGIGKKIEDKNNSYFDGNMKEKLEKYK